MLIYSSLKFDSLWYLCGRHISLLLGVICVKPIEQDEMRVKQLLIIYEANKLSLKSLLIADLNSPPYTIIKAPPSAVHVSIHPTKENYDLANLCCPNINMRHK